MAQPIVIKDGGRGTRHGAIVTSLGQLVTSPVSYDQTIFKELAEPDTAYNFYRIVAGKQFVITGIIAKADKQVSSTVDAILVVYEAASDLDTTPSKVLFQTAVVQGDQLVLLPLNIVVNEGVYINAKTTDDDIYMTVMGYFIDRIT